MASELLQALSRLGARAETFTGLPARAVGALVAIIVGLLLAWLLRALTTRLVERFSRRLPTSLRADTSGGQQSAARVVGRMVYWLVVLLTVMTVTEVLGLAVISAWLTGVANYVPRVFVAIIIVFVGVVAGRLARSALSRATPRTELVEPARLGRIAEITILGVTALVAIQELGIELTFITTVLFIILGAAVGGAGLAFGLGGRETVADILAAHYVRKLYQTGHQVRVNDTSGRIVRITQTSVIVDSEAGEVAIPARLFASSPTLLLRAEERHEQ